MAVGSAMRCSREVWGGRSIGTLSPLTHKLGLRIGVPRYVFQRSTLWGTYKSTRVHEVAQQYSIQNKVDMQANL